MTESYDVVIAGGGIAGLTAATYLARARRRVAVVDAGEPRNAPAAHAHGILSRDGISPADLLATGRAEATGYGAELIEDRVVALSRCSDGFIAHLPGSSLQSRGILVATGLRDELPAIPGVRERWGTDVLHCPYCHGHEVRDQPIAVLGGDNRPFSVHQADLVRQWSADVVFFPHRITLTDEERERLTARNVQIVEGDVSHLVVEGRVTGVAMTDGQVVPRTAVFIGPRFLPRDDLLTGLGCAVGDNGWVTSDPAGRTSIPGVLAAGNVVDSPAQLVGAAGAASVAAIALNHFLLEQDIQHAVTEHRLARAM